MTGTAIRAGQEAAVPCPGCGLFRHDPADGFGESRMLVCRDCGLCFAEIMKGGSADYYKEHVVYRRTDEETVAQHFRSAGKAPIRRLLEMVPPGGRVLDVGCGYGAVVRVARDRGYEAYGLDFNEEQVAMGRTFLGLGDDLVVGDVRALGERFRTTARFDLVTMFEVLEHAEDPVGLVRAVHEVLAPGGLLALSCPNEARWQPAGRVFVDYPPHHLTRWRPEVLRAFLERHGFEHVKTEVEARVRDILWTAYVNRSSRRTAGPEFEGRRTGGKAHSAAWIRRARLGFFEYACALFFPIDLGLRMAGVGTMGQRMIVRKR